MSNNLKLVIFDLDGTLVDAYKAVAGSLNYTLRELDLAPVDDDTIKRTVGWGDRHLVGTFVPRKDVDKAVSIFRRHHSRALKEGTSFLPGARLLIVDLKAKGFLLAVASNRPARFTQIILKHLGARDLFDHVLCGDKVASPKPAPDILEAILKKFSLSPGQALYVGDMAIDVEAGKRAGIRTVAVTTGSNTRKEVARLRPYKTVDHLAGVALIVEKLSGAGRKTAGGK